MSKKRARSQFGKEHSGGAPSHIMTPKVRRRRRRVVGELLLDAVEEATGTSCDDLLTKDDIWGRGAQWAANHMRAVASELMIAIEAEALRRITARRLIGTTSDKFQSTYVGHINSGEELLALCEPEGAYGNFVENSVSRWLQSSESSALHSTINNSAFTPEQILRLWAVHYVEKMEREA